MNLRTGIKIKNKNRTITEMDVITVAPKKQVSSPILPKASFPQ
jgi:hypothetical protein